MMVELTEAEQRARESVCLPLDGLTTLQDVETRVKELSPYVGLFKIGKESYTRWGPKVVELVKKNGGEVFLDLKYHDIPNTVRGAAQAATELGVAMFNVHASGGYEMLVAAKEGVDDATVRHEIEEPDVLGVTLLTSLDNLRFVQTSLPILTRIPAEAGYLDAVEELCKFPYQEAIDLEIESQDERDPEAKARVHQQFVTQYAEPFDALLRAAGLENLVPDTVEHLAYLSSIAGLDGIVCAAADLKDLTGSLPPWFMYVTPGIKGPNTPAGADQKRVYTPGNAIEDGSSILVIGRAITGPATPEGRQQAALDVLRDMAPYFENA